MLRPIPYFGCPILRNITMSGVEVAGLILGVFPLIVSGLEHWREVAKVGGFWWRVRKEYAKCLQDVRFHELLYKRNLEELLLPIVNEADEVARLVRTPGGEDWSNNILQERLEGRLHESYSLYLDIIGEMNEAAEELRKKLSFEKTIVQSQLTQPEPKNERQPLSPQLSSKPSKLSAVKGKWDYETFRLKFSFNESERNELMNRLNECNERLKKLLSSSDQVSSLQNTASTRMKQNAALNKALKKAWKKSDSLFKALQNAWQCTCQQFHFANLRLEHRTLPETCFEIILVSVAPASHANTPWSWKELHCKQMIKCSTLHQPTKLSSDPPLTLYPANGAPRPNRAKPKKVAFTTPANKVPKIELNTPAEPSIKLCQLLGENECGDCMGIINCDDETYHLHPFTKRKRPHDSGPLTLDQILSDDFEGRLTRRQRYFVALLIASSVAQLQFTPWLRAGLTKEDIIFFPCENSGCSVPYHEPFIRQSFEDPHAPVSKDDVRDCKFFALGILLLELCFGCRLEDHPLRRKQRVADGEEKHAFDLMVALKWSQSVNDESGDDYASAVKWCFTGPLTANLSWQSEIIKNVVRPLEICQEHFKSAATS